MTQNHIESLLTELTLDEKLQLIHGAVDPEGTATGYIPPIERLDIPPLRLVDGAVGVRAEGKSATAFPASVALGATWDPTLAHEEGTAMAREARAYQQDVLLGPTVNIMRVPQGGRNFESYSEDPYLSSRTAVEIIEGLQSEGVIATVKHYVANNQETDRHTVSAQISERALREVYLPAFRAAVTEADVASVMSAYNRVNGTHMSDHRRLLTDVLRNEWGFEGYVVSDWYGIASTVGAANAGLDLEMPGVSFEQVPLDGALPDGVDQSDLEFPESLPGMHGDARFDEPLREAVEAGDVDGAVIDEKIRRIFRTMDTFGILSSNSENEREVPEIDTDTHHSLARRVAVEGSVLLKNSGALPLDDDDTIALIGPNADTVKLGGGSSKVPAFKRVSPLDGLRERAADVVFERGVPRITESSLFEAFVPEDQRTERDKPGADIDFEDTVVAAESADCAVVIVQDDATEGQDRADLRLPGGQDDLVTAVADAAERTIVVLRTSGPVELPWIDEVDAVLETWYAGQAGGEALAAMLYGDEEPAGRLPVTFGRQEADYPTSASETYPGVDDSVHYDEGVFVGYRHFDHENLDPLFPFGHGVSYTTFEYGDPTIERSGDTVGLTVPIHNNGDRHGSDVVQVYVQENEPSVPRPPRELKGFKKVRLGSDERQRVSVELNRDAFVHYHEEDGWVTPSGEFTVLVGRSSRDIHGEASVEIE